MGPLYQQGKYAQANVLRRNSGELSWLPRLRLMGHGSILLAMQEVLPRTEDPNAPLRNQEFAWTVNIPRKIAKFQAWLQPA